MEKGPLYMRWRRSSQTVAQLLIGSLLLSRVAAMAQDGWTEHPAHPTGQIIYVSSSTGNDGFGGTSQFLPVRTLARAKSLMREGQADRLLLKRGDVWDESFGDWGRSGLSSTYPMIIGAYGTGARPLVRPGDKYGWRVMNVPAHHVAIVGVHFQANSDPLAPRQSGVSLLGPASDILFEDCYIEGFATNVSVQGFAGPVSDIRVRRCVIVDAVSTFGFPQGIYADTTNGLLVEECVLDYNGWREGVLPKSQFNRNVYIQWDCDNVVFRGNITARSSSAGVSIRSGGIIDGNLSVANPIGIGMGSTSPKAKPEGISGVITNNVVLHGNDIEDWGHGLGLWVSNVTPLQSVEISGNIIAHEASIVDGRAINISAADDPVFNTTVRNNIVYDWGEVLSISGAGLGSNAVRENLFSVTNGRSYLISCRDSLIFTPSAVSYAQNVWHSNNSIWYHNAYTVSEVLIQHWYTYNNWVSFSGELSPTGGSILYEDPERTVETYHLTLGGEATLLAFLTEARKQSRSNWRPEYTAFVVNEYIRDGFNNTIPKISGGGYQKLGLPIQLTVTGVPDEMEFQWVKDGENISGATSKALLINPGELEDSGKYSVVVFDTKSTQTIGPATVEVVTQLNALSRYWMVVLLTAMTIAGFRYARQSTL